MDCPNASIFEHRTLLPGEWVSEVAIEIDGQGQISSARDGREDSVWTSRDIMYGTLSRLSREDDKVIATKRHVDMSRVGYNAGDARAPGRHLDAIASGHLASFVALDGDDPLIGASKPTLEHDAEKSARVFGRHHALLYWNRSRSCLGSISIQRHRDLSSIAGSSPKQIEPSGPSWSRAPGTSATGGMGGIEEIDRAFHGAIGRLARS